MVIGIIGAGASGMAAALAASENPDVQVLLFERQARVGKKLSATGNGRCNLSNIYAIDGGYHGTDPAFADPAISNMPPEKTLEWFRTLGLYTVTETSGKVYPYSDQANSVVDVLRLALDKPNITLYTGLDVQRIRRDDTGFLINDTYRCHKVIIACGGLAGTALGGTMAGYKLLGKFGHRSTRLRASLVQLKSQYGQAALKGVRAQCHIRILHNGMIFAENSGEIQFTENGLSGPVIFEISRDVCESPGEWTAVLDMLPDWTEDQLQQELLRRRQGNLPVEELLTGILHNRLGRVLTKSAGVKATGFVRDLPEQAFADVRKTVKAYEVQLTESMGLGAAQVTAGGVLTADFDPQTLESKLVPGLYACGEVLDIDGDCGGYNLQWAWSSGCLAGRSAGKDAV